MWQIVAHRSHSGFTGVQRGQPAEVLGETLLMPPLKPIQMQIQKQIQIPNKYEGLTK